MSQELIKVYSLTDFKTTVMGRKDFYDEQIKQFKDHGTPSKAVEIIQLLLFKPNGKAILQRRSDDKSHNPGLIDKSVGGHVDVNIAGTNPNTIISLETAQELGANITMVDDIFQFAQAYNSFKGTGDSVGLGHLLDTKVHHLQKRIKGEDIMIASKAHLALGVYGGGITSKDDEVQSVEFIDFDKLIGEIELDTKSEKYTRELGYYIKKYRNDIENLLKILEIKK